MKIRKYIILTAMFVAGLSGLIPLSGMDHLMGKVTGGDKKEAIPGAILFWEGTSNGTATDVEGNFMLAWPDSFPSTLIIKAIGYKSQGVIFKDKTPDHIMVNLLATKDTMNTVTITDRRAASEFPFFKTIMAEGITQNGLRKAACCNLSESFEANATVDVAVTDAVTGAKKIQLLGLDGVYSQILFENLPLIRGLSSSYGLSYVPGTWISAIYITKGAGSVVNGFESIAGQLNIELLKPGDKEDRFFVNVYGNHLGRMETNIHVNRKIGPDLGMTLLTHASTMQRTNDHNHDGFMDMPKYTQFNVMDRFNWMRTNGWQGEYGFKAVYDDRTGGQTNKHIHNLSDSLPLYEIGILNRQAEVFNKTGYVFEKPGRSMGTMFSARYHDEEMLFGLKKYSGEQRSIYANVIYQDIIGTADHAYKIGMSFILDDYREQFNDSAFNRTENIPGVFFEYSDHVSDKFSLVIGSRADLHSEAGFQVTPRIHLKYDITPKTALRVSGGKGFRTANIFPENSMIFASSRQLILETNNKTEIAWNYGGSIQQRFTFLKNDATLVIDFFRTYFTQQLLMNFETPGLLKIQEVIGNSYANSFQADLMLEPIKRFDVRVAYKFYDVWTSYDGEMRVKPLTARHRAFINLAYALPLNKWTFDLTTKWVGSTRLPGAVTMSTKPYFLLSTNVARKYPKLDIYTGVENILNYKQKDPILAANDPFGPNFDASRIYAPTDGITIYAGCRFKIN